ncbi:MAG: redoxin domain-containing protein [Phycisphaerales bacterium]|nr:redoxin domain-containing protein [Phycisphaerales bacterium]
MNVRIVAVATFAVSLAFSAALTQPERQGQPEGRRQFGQQPEGRGGGGEFLALLRGAVNPTEEQWEQLVARHDEYRSAQREAMRGLMPQAAPGERQALTDVDREQLRERVQAAMKPINESFINDCRALLDADQRELFDAYISEADLSGRMMGAMQGGQGRQGAPGGQQPRPVRVGSPAPDTELKSLEGESVSLASLRGKPTVVEFGSYTCPRFREKVADFAKVREEFGDRVNWVIVYTREAHPSDAKPLAVNTRAGVAVAQHASAQDRAKAAAVAKEKLTLGGVVLLDDAENKASEAWGGFPNRAFVIDADGVVASRQVWSDPKETAGILKVLLGLAPPEERPAPRALPPGSNRF